MPSVRGYHCWGGGSSAALRVAVVGLHIAMVLRMNSGDCWAMQPPHWGHSCPTVPKCLPWAGEAECWVGCGAQRGASER